jgi:hypothetical protein
VGRWLSGSIPHQHTLTRIERALQTRWTDESETEALSGRVREDPPAIASPPLPAASDKTMLEELLRAMQPNDMITLAKRFLTDKPGIAQRLLEAAERRLKL